jgi:predicted nucleic acid-binding protein
MLHSRIGGLNLMRALFDEILIPPAVWREVFVGASSRIGVPELRQARWIRQWPMPETELPAQVANLHAGEAEAIALASSMPIATPILLDDLRARHVASDLGLVVIGSGGFLGRAKEAGLIPLVQPILDDLILAGLYLSETAIRGLLSSAGER